MNPLWPALMTLCPLMVGPLPDQQASMVATLCNGGTITIPLQDEAPQLPRECHQKGCHGRCSREDGDG